jgi:hypothetical protein
MEKEATHGAAFAFLISFLRAWKIEDETAGKRAKSLLATKTNSSVPLEWAAVKAKRKPAGIRMSRA